MTKETKATTNKTAVKKTTKSASKTTAKKTTAVKKTATKKPAAKKPVAKKATVSKATASKAAPKNPDVVEAVINTDIPEATKDANNGSSEHTTANETFSSSNNHEAENVFPGLAKDRDWQGFAFRVAYIITFGVLGWLAFGAAITMTVIQVVITILLGAPNETLQSWVSTIGKYLAEVFEYISWNTDEKPFPLGRPVPLDE